MAKARNTTTERMCPDCLGTGAIDVPARDPQLDSFRTCTAQGCVDGWIRWAPVDPLILLAHMRPQKFYRTTQRYQNMLARVAVPVTLPDSIRSRAVSDSERDSCVALQNHRFVMGHFERMLGIAA